MASVPESLAVDDVAAIWDSSVSGPIHEALVKVRSPVYGTRIGISGWKYAPWRTSFYPAGLKQAKELDFASRKVSSIEINGSFYSLQRPSSYIAWRDRTPDNFVFAVKGPRYITHMLQLRDAEIALANFLASGLLSLGDKLGPLLWQLPPRMAFDSQRLHDFLSLLPRKGRDAVGLAQLHDSRLDGRDYLRANPRLRIRHAVEVRHGSFVTPAFVALLRRHKVALVVADTAGRWPLIEDITADFVYVRLHGDQEIYTSGYSNEALEQWAVRIEAWREGKQVEGAKLASPVPARPGPRDVYCYFDNDAKVHAPGDAIRLARRLGVPSP